MTRAGRRKKRILLCAGTRPEVIKLAPVWHALKTHERLEPVMLDTGQHDQAIMHELFHFFNYTPS